MHNRLFNCKNPYQGEAKKVLCVCSAGLLRSPTAAVLLSSEYGYNTRACGIDEGHALIPLDPVLLHWADEIVCMDVQQKQRILESMDVHLKENAHMGLNLQDTPIHVLNVPDRYGYMDKELLDIIDTRYQEVVLHGG